MAFEAQDNRFTTLYRALVAGLAALCVVCMAVYTHEGEGGPLHALQGTLKATLVPAETAGIQLDAAAEGAAQANDDAAASEETLTQLRERNAELTALLAQAEELRKENERLQGLVNIVGAYGVEGPTGRVVGRSTDAWNQTVTLDVGSSSGVEEGLTVIGSTGVVGQVISVAPGSCVVRLLTDPQSGAAALVQSSRAEGVVRGSLAGLLYLENTDAKAELSVGDVVLTSGLGGSYTRGLLIGTIVRIEGGSGDAGRQVVVAPNDTAAPLEELTVVLSAKAALADDAQSGSSGSGTGEGGA
ncbi:MAG: rod shape-determining protein MreC [Eggerthellaceae bacterium]|jgi:rod shape-determining protein MreC|nr:rod shape-determining protein MreC [Eggerthellaceae bacterium]